MAIRVGINGFGRIGRLVFRAGLENSNIEFVGINDPFMSPDYCAYMLKYDTMHGRFNKNISYDENSIIVDGKKIKLFDKMDPSQICAADISQSHTCRLAAMVRKRLHRMGVEKGIRVVFSSEPVPPHAIEQDPSTNHLTTVGTISYMPPLFGCHIAAEVIKILLNTSNTNVGTPAVAQNPS